MRDVEREWEEIFGTLRAELEAGTAPTDPRLDPVRARMAEMIVMFHGGDEGLEAAQREVWENEDPVELTGGALDRELADYMNRVSAGGGGC